MCVCVIYKKSDLHAAAMCLWYLSSNACIHHQNPTHTHTATAIIFIEIFSVKTCLLHRMGAYLLAATIAVYASFFLCARRPYRTSLYNKFSTLDCTRCCCCPLNSIPFFKRLQIYINLNINICESCLLF